MNYDDNRRALAIEARFSHLQEKYAMDGAQHAARQLISIQRLAHALALRDLGGEAERKYADYLSFRGEFIKEFRAAAIDGALTLRHPITGAAIRPVEIETGEGWTVSRPGMKQWKLNHLALAAPMNDVEAFQRLAQISTIWPDDELERFPDAGVALDELCRWAVAARVADSAGQLMDLLGIEADRTAVAPACVETRQQTVRGDSQAAPLRMEANSKVSVDAYIDKRAREIYAAGEASTRRGIAEIIAGEMKSNGYRSERNDYLDWSTVDKAIPRGLTGGRGKNGRKSKTN